MTQQTEPQGSQQQGSEDNSEVSATWLKEQFASFGTKLAELGEGLTKLQQKESQSPPTPPLPQNQPQSQPPSNQAQVRQPSESGDNQRPNGPRSVLRIGTGVRVRK